MSRFPDVNRNRPPPLIRKFTGALALIAALAGVSPADAGDTKHLADAWSVFDIPRIERILGGTSATPPDADRLLLAAAAAAARFDSAAAKTHLAAYEALGDADVERGRRADDIRVRVGFVDQDWPSAAKVLSALVARTETPSAGLVQAAVFTAALVGVPAQTLVAAAPGSSPVRRDVANLLRADVLVNGRPQEMVLDTGANFSTMTASTAKALGLTITDRAASVGNSVAGAVDVRIAIAERLELAGTVLKDVVFLVLADEALSFPGGYSIPAIVGVPVFKAMGRVTVDSAENRLTATPPPHPRRPPYGNLAFDTLKPVVTVEVDGRPLPMLLDTGARLTRLSARFLDLAGPAADAWKVESKESSGAGGRREFRIKRAPRLTLAIGGTGMEMTDVAVTADPGNDADGYYGAIGQDFLLRFRSYTLDFTAMTMTMGAANP